jgi:hypothetical protein
MTPSVPTLKRLFGISGNKCAFPGCQNPILTENGTLIGDMCHIEAHSPGGPRYNSTQTEDEREGFGNLLLLCKIHHPVIDNEYECYTVAVLKKMKAEHEQKYTNGAEPANKVFEKFLQTIAKNNKEIYTRMLRSEIELYISTLELDRPRLLPVDRWTSIVNSGALKLFKDHESGALSRIYQKIKDYNYIITCEHFDRYPWKRLEYEDGRRLPAMRVKQFLNDGASLLDELRTLENAEWLNSM